jgi:hypothetical protein
MRVTPGKSVKASVHVYSTEANSANTVLRLTTSRKTTITPTCNRISGGCNLEGEDADGTVIPVTITIPKGTAAGGITLTATATADEATAKRDTIGITVLKPPASNTTNNDTDDDDESGGSDTNNTNNTNSSNNSSSGGASTGTSTTTGGTLPFSAPGTTGALQAPQPNAQFPEIAPAPADPAAAVAAAAGGQPQNMGALRAAAPEPQELTFQRLASTQAAWLAALLVAFSLLLTQVRLGKPAEARRRKGVHRRTRSGAFQA